MEKPQDFIQLNRVPEWLLATLLSVSAVLVVIHSTVNYCWVTQTCGPLTATANSFGYLFNLNAESNLPTWFSIVILFLAAMAALLLALDERHKGGASLGWWGMVVIFLLLSLDEGSDLHGMLTALVKDPGKFGLHNALFSWVIPGAVIVLFVGLAYLRWIWHLPSRPRRLIILAGTLYVGGALVLEAVGGMIVDETYLNPSYLVVSTLEESCEMAGAILMIYALLDLARQRRIAFAF